MARPFIVICHLLNRRQFDTEPTEPTVLGPHMRQLSHRAPVAQLIEHRACLAGGREFASGPTNTQGL